MEKFYMPIVKTCYKFETQDGQVFCTQQVNYCNYEEEDSRMFYHLSLVATPSNIVMRTNDTDSLVIAVGCKQFYDNSLKLWLEVGKKIHQKIQSSISVLIRHVKNLIYHYAMRYQLFMRL